VPFDTAQHPRQSQDLSNVRNREYWYPTKYAVSPGGSVSAPAVRNEVAAGSILIATLIARWYERQLPRHAHGILLDLGCGKVPLYQMYEPFVEDVICTDWPGTLHGTAFIDFANDLNLGIPLADETVDTVVLSDVLEHLYRPALVLEEISRVLRPGGTALINAPFLYMIHEAPHDFYRYTPYALAQMARDAGLDVVCTDSVGSSAFVLADIVGKMLCRVPGLGRHAASGLQRLALTALPDARATTTYPLFVATVLRKPQRKPN
jgi:SAM-dependent methyltransferase